MTFDELKEKALSLPYVPGVYLMRDKTNKVIYVGKAKKLKNRVSQYFQDTASHSLKTKMMVSKIHNFDVIIAASEFEALVLECSLIKRHMPKYNILLKDDKGYPYLRLDMKEIYPRISLVNKISDDGANYYGPYGSRGTTQAVLNTVLETLRLPSCTREFPRDIGKDRPCLNYHMKMCDGWCRTEAKGTEYRTRVSQARQLLQGNYKGVSDQIKEQMLAAADNLEFELAASLRDRLNAVQNLGMKQLVTAGSLADTDVIGYGESGESACFAVLHFSAGNLLDKEYEVFTRPDDSKEAVSSLLKQFYLNRGIIPKNILLPFEIEDGALFAQFVQQQMGKTAKLRVPQRGDNLKLIELANKNAFEEVTRITGKEEKYRANIVMLGKMLSIDPPKRIESYDISNISGTDIVASMVVFEDGKPKKSEYKKFKVELLDDQNDIASMQQIISRRFDHFIVKDKGFDQKPDLILIDGGATHAKAAVAVLKERNLNFLVLGMVKDDRHRTRALVTPEDREIAINVNPTVFSFIGNIQEETHRFAITFHRAQRSKRLRYSALDEIPGIGPKRKQELLKQFKSLTAISQASISELERILPKDAASAVFEHFRKE